MNKGWICARCGKSLAPWMSECNCKPKDQNITITVDGTQKKNEKTKIPDWWDYSSINPCITGGSDYWDKTTSSWSNILKNVRNDIKGI